MKDENIELLSHVIETMDNVRHAMNLPIGDAFHVEQMKSQIPDWKAKLIEIYKEETGDNPWS